MLIFLYDVISWDVSVTSSKLNSILIVLMIQKKQV